MNDLELPLISKFVNLGCSQQNAAASYQVYMELTEVRRMFDINYHYCNSMNRMYFTAKNSKTELESLFFPISSFESASFAMMKEIIQLCDNKSCYFAIISPDSTCVFYQVSEGLSEPGSSSLVSKMSISGKHDNEISQNREEIEKLASLNKCNTSNVCTKRNENK